jgi:hypothetical protein
MFKLYSYSKNKLTFRVFTHGGDGTHIHTRKIIIVQLLHFLFALAKHFCHRNESPCGLFEVMTNHQAHPPTATKLVYYAVVASLDILGVFSSKP